jgi:protein-disulfide isomerase
MSLTLERVATATITVAALVVTVAVVRRELSGPRLFAVATDTSPPQYVENWQQLGRSGRWIGDSNARIRIVEFADFECPFCAQFFERVHQLQSELGSDVGVLFVHYPLTGHRFAQPAARAAECAAHQGRFAQMHNALFAKQDSFGLRSWSAYATDAGLTDMAEFGRCVAGTAPLDEVSVGLAAGKRLQVHGTPTVIINGWRYAVAPFDSLRQVAEATLRMAH